MFYDIDESEEYAIRREEDALWFEVGSDTWQWLLYSEPIWFKGIEPSLVDDGRVS